MKRFLGYAAFVIGLVMMCIGFMRGEAGIVLKKAIVLCLECIGLG